MKKNFCRIALLVITAVIVQVQSSGQQIQLPERTPFQLRPSRVHTTPASGRLTACSNDEIILTRQSQVDSFPITNPGCNVVRKLVIDGIDASPAITNLDSLYEINEITQTLAIFNTSVTSLSGLNNLTVIADTFQLGNNELLTNIGMINLSYLGEIIFRNLPSLTSLAGLSNNLDTTGHITIDTSGLTDLGGLSGIVYIDGSLEIHNTPILNLSDLTSLTFINGYLSLESNPVQTSIGLNTLNHASGFLFSNMPNLATMQGMTDNLVDTDIGTFWSINTGIADFTGFEGVTSCSNFYIWLNPNLTTLSGLGNLAGNIDGGLSLWANDQLTDITALSNITSMNYGTLEVHGNNLLSDFTSFSNITDIGHRLRIFENPNITSLSFLNPNLVIHDYDSEGLEIHDNVQLSLCSSQPLCNYLGNGGTGEIENNGPGCSSIAEILASCNACSIVNLKTWTGSNGNDWDDGNNWLPSGMPAPCDSVVLPANLSDYPVLPFNVTIGSLSMEPGSTLDMNSHSILIKRNIHIESAFVFNGQSLTVEAAYDPYIAGCDITADNILINNYLGTLALSNNYIYGNVTLSDDEARDGPNEISGNNFGGNLSITANSADPNAVTHISTYQEDEVDGDATFTIKTPAAFGIATGYDFRINRNLVINSNITGSPYIGTVDFTGFDDSHIQQLGSEPIRITNFNALKSGGSMIYPDQDVFITNTARFLTGVVKTTADKKLVFLNGSSVSSWSSASYVWGPIKKTGNTPFTFPAGDSIYRSVITMGIPSPSAPTDVYQLQYFHRDPTSAGYDTALHVPALGYISGREYWLIERLNGNANMQFTFYYDSARSGPISSIYDLRIARWDGSTWQSEGNGGVTGNLSEANVKTAAAVSQFGIFSFGFNSYKPVITIGNMDTMACNNHDLVIPFTVDSSMLSYNLFTAQLSDSSGSFASPTNIGFKSSNHSDIINGFIVTGIVPGNHYRVRVIGSAPADTSTNYRSLKIITKPSNATVISGPVTGCINGGIHIYYANQKEEGVNYNWTLSGGGSMTTNADTAYITWTSPGYYTLALTTSNTCGSGVFTQKVVNVSPPPPTAAPVLNKIGRWLYASAADAGQNALGFHWYKDGNLINGDSLASYYASSAGVFTVKYYNLCGNGPASNSISFAANSVPQTINFPSISDKVYTDVPFAINATASSGLPVSLILISGPGSLSGNNYTITGTGLVTIKAIQPGDDVYDTAAYILRSFTVNKASQAINFPSIPDQNLALSTITLGASASSGLPVSYSLVSGPATLTGNQLTFTGIGNIVISVSQNGDANYLPATTVNQTICVRVAALSPIAGPLFICPGQTASYSVNSIAGLQYNWRLTNGTTFGATGNSVDISIPSSGTYTLLVSATGPCGAASANDTLVINVVAAITPGAVSNMLPANGSIDQHLPLSLSWIPGSDALTYDLYVWDSAATQPSVPFATNITGTTYIIPAASLAYNKSYKWRLVSRNACLQTDGPIQYFRLRPLPDLAVTDVQAPATASSGQTISISWKVTNNGPGNTGTNQSWTDAVFLSFDSLPNFNIPPNTSSGVWSQFDLPIRPLLIGTKPNVSALDSGQQYSNSINFTIPLNYAQPLYAYVITNYPAGSNAPTQMTYANDTARAPEAIAISLSPTPDLRVDTVFIPSSVFSGATINITYKVKNYGVLTPVGSQWTDKFYISQSPIFNINNATLLQAPKANGTYYPGTSDAMVTNQMQLLADSSYTKNVQVVIPNFIFGSYFIYVFTNTSNSLYEGALANNNVNQSPLQIFLTPTPQLTVSSMTVPVSTASTTQPIGANWNILNAGFNDNKEKNKGHYYIPGTITCASSSLQYTDSVGFGSSYWIDKLYLSPDSTGINGNAILIGDIAQGGEYDSYGVDFTPPLICVPNGTAPQNVNTANVIKAGSNHPVSYNFNIPADLQPGNYYLYVRTNATQTVFEYPGTAQIKRTQLPITIQRPDLTVPTVTVPASISGGQQMTIEYTVLNNGPGSVFNASRKDKVYVSSSPVFDGSAQLIATQSYTESLPANVPVIHSLTYSFPGATSGSRYIYIHTNFDSTFRELTYTNNISAGALVAVSSGSPADLVVSGLQLADSVFTQFNTPVKLTVTNNGPATATGTWTDSLFISCSSAYNPATSYFIATRTQSRTVGVGEQYVDSFNINMPFSYLINNCFPVANNSNAWFFVKANADNKVYEGSNGNNNAGGSGSRVLINPHVDHIVTSVMAADTATVARPYPATWTVKNIGYNPGGVEYNSWTDGIYFSPDSIFNSNAVLASIFAESSRLNKNQSYTDSRIVTPPNIPTGDYYVFAYSNNSHNIHGEIELSNNASPIRNTAGAAKKIHVIQPLLADLTDTIINAPATIALGQPLTVVHTLTNSGAGPTYPNGWSNELWLSTDFIPGNVGDIRLSAKNFTALLNASQSMNDTINATIALTITPGNYILISKTDAGNSIFESNETNNLAFSYLNIYSPNPVDLLVQQVTVPDTAYLGYTIDTAKWVIANNSPNNAAGFSADGIYLSKTTTLDSTATLLAVVNKNINIAPLATATVTNAALVTNVTEGNYNVLVKTDLLNNIVETNKNNNTGVAMGKLYVKVKELKLNIAELNTLSAINRHYKLIIPDSLRGSTVLINLKTNDSLTMRNEMFVGLGYVPTPAHYDYRFETPNYGNQQILMTSVTDSVYYITVRCASLNPVIQNITLTAVKLPFAILNVQSNTGGNSGNVTVKIRGSLFTTNMGATLSRPGTTITASAVYYTNSTTVYATFNLQGKTLGVYDLKLIKTDASEALLAGGFTIVTTSTGGVLTGGGANTGPNGTGNDPGCNPGASSGYNSQLLTELVIPEKVFAGWIFTVQVNFVNPTNVDIPTQTRILYNDWNVPMALAQAGLNDNMTALYVELAEQGGPPGIIRAGGSGSIIIYARAPITIPGHTIVHFNLK